MRLNMLKQIIEIAIYNFKYLLRNFKANAIIFVLPIVFIGVFALAFGSDDSDITYRVAIVETDWEKFDAFYDTLADVSLESSSDSELFMLKKYSTLEKAKDAYKSDDLDGVLYIDGENAKFYGNPASISFGRTSGIIGQVVDGFDGVSSRFTVESIQETDANLSGFELLAPGLIIYGILMLIPGVAERFTDIIESKQIFRYANSRMSATAIIIGSSLYFMVLAIIQVLLLYFATKFVGVEPQSGIWLPMLIAVPTGLFVIALGLLVGALSSKKETATNISTLFTIVLGFLSGSFITGVSNLMRFEIFGREISFTDIFPTKHATDAMSAVILEGEGFGAISSTLAYISVVSFVLLALAIVVYKQKHLKPV